MRLNIMIASVALIAGLGAWPGGSGHAEEPGAGLVNNPLLDPSKVAGRTYCVVTSVWANHPAPGFELRSRVARRMTTFLGGGVYTTVFLSEVENRYLADGTVVTSTVEGSDGFGTYTQSGTKLNVVLSSGAAATWYVSGDGSTIHGTRIAHLPVAGGIGVTTHWTLVESDVCDAEL